MLPQLLVTPEWPVIATGIPHSWDEVLWQSLAPIIEYLALVLRTYVSICKKNTYKTGERQFHQQQVRRTLELADLL